MNPDQSREAKEGEVVEEEVEEEEEGGVGGDTLGRVKGRKQKPP